MNVDSICNRNVVIADQATDALTAARLMHENHVGTIIIVDDINNAKRPIGIISDRDLVIEVLAKDVSPAQVTLKDAMNPDLICVRDDDDMMETVKIMCLEGIRRVPVVNEQGQLTGILTMDDLFEILADELSNLALLMGREKQSKRQLSFS